MGKGGFGSVYEGHWKSKNMTVAIKRVPGKINRQEVSTALLTFNFVYDCSHCNMHSCKSYDCYNIG